jgi:hypothetical protein
MRWQQRHQFDFAKEREDAIQLIILTSYLSLCHYWLILSSDIRPYYHWLALQKA